MLSNERSGGNLKVFKTLVENAISNEAAEKLLRDMLSGVPGTCPVPLLVMLGQVVADYRENELKRERESN